MIRGSVHGELLWLVWFLFGLTLEMLGVFFRKQTGIEPLTAIVRDRLFASRYGEAFIAVFIGFFGWLVWHWTVKRGPQGQVPGTAERDDYDDDEDSR